MASTLRSTLQDLASSFASSVLDAIRGASLEEILGESDGGRASRSSGRAASLESATPSRRGAPAAPAAPASSRRRGGRLARRSADDIGAMVERIVELLTNSSEGLRAEQIRDALGVEAKELPRPLAEALASKRIIKSGQKRATTYFARGAAKAGRGGSAKGGRGPGRKAAGRKPAAKGRRAARRRDEGGEGGEGGSEG
jgi:hypothetical protein